ncbi:MAG TPA: Gfo/Idh/MocA family oxidoreductase [Verrucomicrobiae bacterium]|nr:Gfo/Idh/MocA family oxidoreductase [Verrucomicrobiae bacterium]
MTKVLLLGLGRWGLNHLRNLREMPAELFVAENDAHRLKQAAQTGVSESHLTTRHRDFLPLIDAAVVVTPAPTHYPLALEFLEAGKDVFVEKPMTLAAADAHRLAEFSEANRRILQTGHIFRFDSAAQWLHEAIRAEKFGVVRMLRGNLSAFKRPRNDSGMIFAEAIHLVDLFNYLLGQTPKRVQAVAHDFLGRGMEDAALLSLEYHTAKSVTWATVEANCFLPGKFREVSVIGSEMSAVCDLGATKDKLKLFSNRHENDGTEFKAIQGPHQIIETKHEEPLKAELHAFLDSVVTRRSPAADGRAGHDAVRVLEAALQSSRTGRVVDV